MAAASEGSAAACARRAAEAPVKRDEEECGRREECWTEAIISS